MEWQNGIDTIAHKTTIEEKGNTIAVLGCGFKNIYPKENEQLYQQIIQNGGLVISEYEPETEAKSANFLRRNRIISGLSLGILIIESAYRSGTSVTARIAKEQGRKVFALPGEIDNKKAVGNNRLIKNKIATLVCTTKEIIDEIENIQYIEIKDDQKNNKKSKKAQNKCEKINKRKICENDEYNTIYQLITENPCTLDEIYKKSKKSISEINNILLMLEIDGYIEKVAKGYKCIVNRY